MFIYCKILLVYMIFSEWFIDNFLNEIIYLHLVKWFQVFH